MVATRRQSKASQQHRAMRLPEVLLDAVLAFSDLRTRSLAVTTSHEFCESYARLAKTLEPRLVREPLLPHRPLFLEELLARGHGEPEERAACLLQLAQDLNGRTSALTLPRRS